MNQSASKLAADRQVCRRPNTAKGAAQGAALSTGKETQS